MQLSSTLINKFQEVYQITFGESISLEAAERDLLDLAELLRITQKLPESEHPYE